VDESFEHIEYVFLVKGSLQVLMDALEVPQF
jgi:hypothetical protein